MSVKDEAKSNGLPPPRPPSLLERGMAEAVIGRALLAVLQDLVGFGHFLEFVLAGVVAVIAVGVKFFGELPIGALDLFDRGALLATQDFVITALAHGLTTQNTADSAIGKWWHVWSRLPIACLPGPSSLLGRAFFLVVFDFREFGVDHIIVLGLASAPSASPPSCPAAPCTSPRRASSKPVQAPRVLAWMSSTSSVLTLP